jgi:hypothetical protein
MKLNELIYEMGVSASPIAQHGIDLSIFKNFQPLGDKNSTIEQCYVEVSSVINHNILFRLYKDDKPVALLAALVCPKYKNRPTIQIMRTWVEPEYRNKGLMTGFIDGLCRKWNYVIISDVALSPESESVWKKIHATLHPSLYNMDAHTILDPTEYKFNDYFRNKGNVFLLEGPQPGPPFYIPYAYTHADIVSDYIVYMGKDGLP